MRTEFLNEALKHVPSPEVLVNMVSRRVRQLGQGFRPLVPVNPQWSFMEVALKEIADQKLSYELTDSDEKTVKSRRRSRRA